jgi:Arc/MetJ-type ribon-helix-helix transcriptional regulator
MMATITCKLPEAMAAELDALAREERRSKSAVLRDALEERLKAKRRPGTLRAIDLVKHLCGALQGGPTDLATNPEHLRGFGE